MGKRIAVDLNDVLRDYTRRFINIFNRYVDSGFDVTEEEVTSSDFSTFFPFKSDDEYRQFLYIDYAYEIFGRAESTEKNKLPYRFNDWVQRDMRDFDDEDIPEIMIVSPMESNLTIQSTLVFLSKYPSRVREIYFPADSSTVWDRCDILITANPLFLNSVPEGKICVKINKSYNKDIDTGYSFDSMLDLIEDKDNVFYKLVENG